MPDWRKETVSRDRPDLADSNGSPLLQVCRSLSPYPRPRPHRQIHQCISLASLREWCRSSQVGLTRASPPGHKSFLGNLRTWQSMVSWFSLPVSLYVLPH